MNERSTTRGLMFLKSKGKVKLKDTKRIERKLLIRTFNHFPKYYDNLIMDKSKHLILTKIFGNKMNVLKR